jgi:TRAP-type C4-dicarboxylate transport system permease small subunit
VKSPLEPLYRFTGALAVACLAGIAAIILADVALRQFGGQIKSSDDFAGFALVGTAMLGLAPTYRQGEQIRVGLLLERFSGTARRYVEILVLLVATIMVGWATWWIGRFVYDSWQYHEVSQGLIAVNLWIPQSLMFLGIFVLLLAIVEDLVRMLSGLPASYMTVEQVEGEVARYE